MGSKTAPLQSILRHLTTLKLCSQPVNNRSKLYLVGILNLEVFGSKVFDFSLKNRKTQVNPTSTLLIISDDCGAKLPDKSRIFAFRPVCSFDGFRGEMRREPLFLGFYWFFEREGVGLSSNRGLKVACLGNFLCDKFGVLN